MYPEVLSKIMQLSSVAVHASFVRALSRIVFDIHAKYMQAYLHTDVHTQPKQRTKIFGVFRFV